MPAVFSDVRPFAVSMLALWTATACGGATARTGAGPPDGGAGAGNADAGASPSLGNSDDAMTTEYADVRVEQDFTQPVWLPPPSTIIRGDATSLLGTWDEVSTDGGMCGSDYECFQLVFQPDASGAVHGTIREVSRCCSYPAPPQGPFAPATDPNVGYPTTVDPTRYFYLKGISLNVDYRLFDPVLQSSTLTFWFSPLDLWSDWCALQTASEWKVGGQIKYRCVPQTASSSTIDFGKYILCTSAEDGPQCTDSRGYQGPCVCADDSGIIGTTGADLWLPLCTRTVCECSATQCRGVVRDTEMNGSLVLSGGVLSGTIDGIFYPSAPVTFRRVGP
jgi:hypothetical protein